MGGRNEIGDTNSGRGGGHDDDGPEREETSKKSAGQTGGGGDADAGRGAAKPDGNGADRGMPERD